MPDVLGLEANSPAPIAQRFELVGVAKARLGLVQFVSAGMLAGAFTGFEALFSTLVYGYVTFNMDQERNMNILDSVVVQV